MSIFNEYFWTFLILASPTMHVISPKDWWTGLWMSLWWNSKFDKSMIFRLQCRRSKGCKCEDDWSEDIHKADGRHGPTVQQSNRLRTTVHAPRILSRYSHGPQIRCKYGSYGLIRVHMV